MKIYMQKYMFYILISLSLAFYACNADIQSSASFTVSVSEAPLGTQITFNASASDGPITSFEWNFGDETYGTGQIINHIYVTAKVFTVTLTIRDSEGGAKTSSAQVDIYREGFQMALTPLRTGPLGAPELWIDAITSQDPITGTVWIAISELGFDPPSITENHIFTLTLPGDLVEFTGIYQLTERALQYQYDGADIISNIHPTVIFKVFYCIGQARSQFLLVQLRMKSLGTGTIDMKAQKGVSCYTAAKFAVESFPANIIITSIKYHDN